MCGFCQGTATATLTLAQDTGVSVTTADLINSPYYYNLAVEKGKTYRIRAWPDIDNGIRGMLLIVANPSGTPIRRVISQSGSPLDSFTSQAFRPLNLTELDEAPFDVETGCVGDSHIDIVFKAEEGGDYVVGLGQATDANLPRSEFDSNADYSAQFRATESVTGEGGFSMMVKPSAGIRITGRPLMAPSDCAPRRLPSCRCCPLKSRLPWRTSSRRGAG